MNNYIYIDGWAIDTSDVGAAIQAYENIFGQPRVNVLRGEVINLDALLATMRAELLIKDKEITEMKQQITMLFELVCDLNNINR